MRTQILFMVLIGILLAACDSNQESVAVPDQAKLNQENISNSSNVTKKYDAEVINFEGFGPAKFGDNEESVRMSWGHPLNVSQPEVGATCYYLHQKPMSESRQQIAFMFEDGQFVRYDVDDPKWVAPGNIAVGDTMASVLQAHAGRIKSQPHKYIQDAHTLIVTPLVKSNASLIFETDAKNIVIKWRIGVSPQVYYVEGCS